MGKKAKSVGTSKPAAPQPADEPITSLGWKMIAGGAAIVIAGFFALSKADTMGRNWAADAAPLLILAGYALIGLGIFTDDPIKGGEQPPAAPPTQP